MPLADVVEIYLPAHRDFGWVRARTWWGSIVTFKLPSDELEEMVDHLRAQPQDRPAINPKVTLKSHRYATRWPPAAQASAWLLRERVGRRTRWRSMSTRGS